MHRPCLDPVRLPTVPAHPASDVTAMPRRPLPAQDRPGCAAQFRRGPDTSLGADDEAVDAPAAQVPDLPAVFSTPGHLQPAELAAAYDGGEYPPAVWLIIDHAHGRCLGFHTTEAIARAWARFWVFNGLVERSQCSVQAVTLLSEPPDGQR